MSMAFYWFGRIFLLFYNCEGNKTAAFTAVKEIKIAAFTTVKEIKIAAFTAVKELKIAAFTAVKIHISYSNQQISVRSFLQS